MNLDLTPLGIIISGCCGFTLSLALAIFAHPLVDNGFECILLYVFIVTLPIGFGLCIVTGCIELNETGNCDIAYVRTYERQYILASDGKTVRETYVQIS